VQNTHHICCISLVLCYLDDMLRKNYNYIVVFVIVMPETILVPFFPDTVYLRLTYCPVCDAEEVKRLVCCLIF